MCLQVTKGLSIYVILIVCDARYLRALNRTVGILHACVKQYPYLLGLELVDSSSTELSMLVDMLIRSRLEAFAEELIGLHCPH